MSSRSDQDIARATASFLGGVAAAGEEETFVPSQPAPSRPSQEFQDASPEPPPQGMNEIRAAQAAIYQKLQAADSGAIASIANIGRLVAKLISSTLGAAV